MPVEDCSITSAMVCPHCSVLSACSLATGSSPYKDPQDVQLAWSIAQQEQSARCELPPLGVLVLIGAGA